MSKFIANYNLNYDSIPISVFDEIETRILQNDKSDFYDLHQGKDGEDFRIGNLTLKLLHTPGHTMESSSFLLTDEKGNTPYVFTGDCLFIGDVGRPDLAVKSDLTETDLAGHLFDSLRNKIMPLPNDITVYPGHGAVGAGWLSHAPPVSFEAVVHIQCRRVTGGTPDNLGGDARDGHVRRNVFQHDASGTHFGTFTYLDIADHFASGGE